MAEKKASNLGGCLVQIVLGFLALVAAVLAVMFFLSSGPLDAEEGPSLADDAAARVPAVATPVEPPPQTRPTSRRRFRTRPTPASIRCPTTRSPRTPPPRG